MPPRVSFFQEAGELFLGQFTRNAERASAPDFAFTGHLNYANTLLSDFLLTVAGTKVDALQLNGIMLLQVAVQTACMPCLRSCVFFYSTKT